MDIYGFGADECDAFQVTGNMSLGGTVHLNFPGTYQPTVGQTFDIINAGGVISVVNPVFTSSLGAGYVFDIDATAPGSLIRVKTFAVPPATLPGDFNNDDKVDAADYVVLRKGFGPTYTEEHFDIWRTNFGNARSGGGSTADASEDLASVPEPATWGMLLVAIAAVSVRKRSTRS